MTRVLCRFSKTFNSSRRISDSFCIYSSRDFGNMPEEVARANRSGSAVVKVLGRNLPRLADWTIAFHGEWRRSKKYGYTLYADRYELMAPSTLKGTARFLSSRVFPGIGEKTAEAIVEEFREDTLSVIESTPDLLLRVPGVSVDKADTIARCYRENMAYSRLCSYLTAYSIGPETCSKISEALGGSALESIRRNPYVLQGIERIGFRTCERIARAEGAALDSIERMEGAARDVLVGDAECAGNMFMAYGEFERRAMDLLNGSIEPAPVGVERFRRCIESAARSGRFAFRAGKFILLRECDDAEETAARKIAQLLDPSNAMRIRIGDARRLAESYCSVCGTEFSEEQKDAVVRSLMSRLSIITGGPGTGKTTILKAIIAVYGRLHPGEDIALLAPTGKAARRMSETTGLDASTIHSRLQIHDDGRGIGDTIAGGLVVVDEASMIDAMVFARLMESINARTTQVIIVGDVDQLPSVGPGLVLRDMIDSGAVPVSRLTEIFRQKDDGKTIVSNAKKVIEGDADLCYDQSFRYVEVKDERDAVDRIREIYAQEASRWGIDNVALLSPLRRTQGRFLCVSDGLNAVLQEEIVPKGRTSAVFSGTEYRIGDRIMQWRNGKESSNGDIGTIADILQTDDGVEVKVDWENGNSTSEDRDAMGDMTLAYSISIHKSQGSEYDCVIIPLLSSQICGIFRSNLLYTGMTRARKKLVLVCDGKRALNRCISNRDADRRNSLLSLRIRDMCKEKAAD